MNVRLYQRGLILLLYKEYLKIERQISNSLIENGARDMNKQFKEKKEMSMLLNYVKIYEHSLKVEKNKSDIGKENN